METFAHRNTAAVSSLLLGFELWCFIQKLSLLFAALALEELDGTGHLAVVTASRSVRLPYGKCPGILFWGLFQVLYWYYIKQKIPGLYSVPLKQ